MRAWVSAHADTAPVEAAAVAVRPAQSAWPAPGCSPAPPLVAQDLALARQRVVAALASGSGGDAVVALLMQSPAGEDAGWAEQVRQAALRSQDVRALRWAAAACTSPAKQSTR